MAPSRSPKPGIPSPMRRLARKGAERRRVAPDVLEPDLRGTAPPRCAAGGRVAVDRVAPDARPLICVAGASSNAGKTWLCERLLEAFAAAGRPARALKVTRTHLDSCPRQNDGCGVCDDLESAYRLVTGPEEIDVSGKDTGRYVAAGAAEVRWLIVDPAHVAHGVAAALDGFGPGPLVVEGNSFLDHAEGVSTALLAVTGQYRIKPSALHVLDRVDAFVGPADAEAALRPLLRDRGLTGRPWVRPDEVGAWVLARD